MEFLETAETTGLSKRNKLISWITHKKTDGSFFPFALFKEKVLNCNTEDDVREVMEWVASWLQVQNLGSLLSMFRLVGYSGCELVADEDTSS